MKRLFNDHIKRKVTYLDGLWKFKAVDSDEVLNSIPKDAVDMYVPSCWNFKLGLLEYQGLAWYFKKITANSENILLTFGAVSGTARVYLDGTLLGSHYGSYTEFSVTATVSKGEHLLGVLIDNKSDFETIPKIDADWYRYGGIFRGVELAEIEDIWISRHKISYSIEKSSAKVIVETETQSFSGNTPEELSVKFDGKVVYSGKYSNQIEFDVNDIKLWDVFEPNLYFVEISADKDDIIDRIGFRTIEAKNRKFLINGKEIEIKGVNHHEDWPDFGHAVPYQLMERDIDIIKDLGCNFIRGSHYPNSRAFLDYLDQNGLMFWSEIPLWGAKEDSLKSELLINRGCKMHKEMAEQYYNHPSIVMWGLHNEIDTTVEAGRAITEKFAAVLRNYDPSRPLVMATDKTEDDICLDLVDIIGINKYIGWYGGKMDAWQSFLDTVAEKLKNENADHKPVIMSEFGAAAIYGWHTFDNVRWTEEYQANLIDYELDLFKKTPYICGSLVWQFTNGRTSASGTDRARGFNNKGILDEYRKPKAAYYTVKKHFKGE